MPSEDVGRNDPCPCGSGAKYKYCCLRNPKKSKPAPAPDWRQQLESSAERLFAWRPTLGAGQSAIAAAEDLFDCWDLLDEHLPADVVDLSTAQSSIQDGAPSVESVLLQGMRAIDEAAFGDPEVARRGAAWCADVLGRFPEADDEMRVRLRVLRADCLAFSMQWDKLKPLARQLIDERPHDAQAYALLSDALVRDEPRDAPAAIEILERALELPVDNAEDWDLEMRLKDARWVTEDEPETKTDSSDGEDSEQDALVAAYEAASEQFDEADLDTRFELARDLIANEPLLDGEWAFSMLVEWLMLDARAARRYGEWADLVELLRDERPEVAREEGGTLGMHEIEFRIWSGDRRLCPAVELLFSGPLRTVDFIFGGLDVLAYFGELPLARPHLNDKWEDVVGSDEVTGISVDEWADYALTAELAHWAEDDIERSVEADAVADAAGAVSKRWNLDRLDAICSSFFGAFDEPNVRETLDAVKSADDITRLAFGYGRALVTEYNWPISEALTATNGLESLWHAQSPLDDANPNRYRTNRRSEVSSLETRLKDEAWLVPNPDLVDGLAGDLLSQRFMGTPRPAAAFLEAVSYLPDWLQSRKLVEPSRVLESVCHHLQKRIDSATAELVDAAGKDPLMRQNLQESAERLED